MTASQPEGSRSARFVPILNDSVDQLASYGEADVVEWRTTVQIDPEELRK